MSYDVFLSYSHVDKVWTRDLHDRLATTDYNGRVLRTWLDERILDPGDLSSPRELESALDRSCRLVVVLSPQSLDSHWVQSEIGYFLRIRNAENVILIRRRPCTIPDQLAGTKLMEWPESVEVGNQFEQLLRFLCPAADDQVEYDHRKAVRRAWGNAKVQQPDDPVPTKASHELLELLLSYNITDLDKEGPALAGFDRAGQLVGEMDAAESYGMRMVLGEFLAIAVLRNASYAQVGASYIQRDIQSEVQPSFLTRRNRLLQGKSGAPLATNLLFVVARSGSKLAEIDPSRVDLSTMAAVLHRLDQCPEIGRQERIVAIMVGRALGKLRNSSHVDALLYTLVKHGGVASHIAAAAAISTTFDSHDPVVFYTEELKRLAVNATAQPILPPLPRIARLLLEPPLSKENEHEDVRSAHREFTNAFGSKKPAEKWPELRVAPPATTLENGPLVGIVWRVTLGNMESYADRLGPADIACLTEPRIVDALLDGAGGYLIDHEQADAPLGKRLHLRGTRFATYGHDILDRFEDGSVITLWPSREGVRPMGFVVRVG